MHSRVPQVGSAPKSVRERQNPTQLAGQPFNVGQRRQSGRSGAIPESRGAGAESPFVLHLNAGPTARRKARSSTVADTVITVAGYSNLWSRYNFQILAWGEEFLLLSSPHLPQP